MSQGTAGVSVEQTAKALGCKAEVLESANYSEQKLSDIFRSAVRSKKITDYVQIPSGLFMIGCLFASAFVKQSTPALTIPFAVAALVYVASRIADRRDSMRAEVRRDALAQLISDRYERPVQPEQPRI